VLLVWMEVEAVVLLFVTWVVASVERFFERTKSGLDGSRDCCCFLFLLRNFNVNRMYPFQIQDVMGELTN
jgi:hypothetical protein